MAKKSTVAAPAEDEQKKPDIRTRHCACFLTENDANTLEEFALSAGFTSRGQLMTAIMERLIIGGFSGVAFLKTCLQLQKFAANAQGTSRMNWQNGFYFGVRPLPALPDQHISETQLKRELQAISKEILELEKTNA